MIQSWLAQMGEGVVSIAISCAAAILSGLVLVIRSNRDDRVRARALVVEIWKMWMSPEMRRVRVLISCAIRGSEHGPPRGEKIKYSEMLSAAADKLETETAIGTLEHFFVELAELKRVRTLDRKLFSALFSKTVSSWRQYFDEIEYDIDQARPMQRSALQALKDLQTK